MILLFTPEQKNNGNYEIHIEEQLDNTYIQNTDINIFNMYPEHGLINILQKLEFNLYPVLSKNINTNINNIVNLIIFKKRAKKLINTLIILNKKNKKKYNYEINRMNIIVQSLNNYLKYLKLIVFNNKKDPEKYIQKCKQTYKQIKKSIQTKNN